MNKKTIVNFFKKITARNENLREFTLLDLWRDPSIIMGCSILCIAAFIETVRLITFIPADPLFILKVSIIALLLLTYVLILTCIREIFNNYTTLRAKKAVALNIKDSKNENMENEFLISSTQQYERYKKENYIKP